MSAKPAAFAFSTHVQALPLSRPSAAHITCVTNTRDISISCKSFFGRTILYRTTQSPASKLTFSRASPRMLVDPWSVSPEAVDALAAQFFAASLIPYLAFLYFLSTPEANCPKLANFGFRFLLIFVFATIPAGIYAKVHYHDILANIDWLHGGAESLLTVTNFLIVLGFRNSISNTQEKSEFSAKTQDESNLQLRSASIAMILSLTGSTALAFHGFHAEPANALSFPTWIIHLSSLVEWLVAMGLVWKYAEVTGNQKWKGLTWGMLPLHTSGICACTYHFFYNAPQLNILVALQAALTCFGNATMAAAAFRISRNPIITPFEDDKLEASTGSNLVGFEDMASQFESDTNFNFFWKVFIISCGGSALVKWGSLLFDAPFNHSVLLALAIIGVPTLLNMAKWGVRSKSGSSDFGGFI